MCIQVYELHNIYLSSVNLVDGENRAVPGWCTYLGGSREEFLGWLHSGSQELRKNIDGKKEKGKTERKKKKLLFFSKKLQLFILKQFEW